MRRGSGGFSLIELLVSLTVFSLAMASVAGVLVQNSRINKVEQLRAEAQANARNCLSLIVQRLRSAGWDPLSVTASPVTLDPTPADAESYIEIFADLNADGDLDDEGESVLIRHLGETVEWRTSSGGSLVPLATDISNDADGNGVSEPMFVPDSTTEPTSVLVRITAESAVNDPRTGEPIRYTVESEVALRASL